MKGAFVKTVYVIHHIREWKCTEKQIHQDI